MSAGQACLWALPPSNTAQHSPSVAAKPHTLQLQLIFVSTIAALASAVGSFMLPGRPMQSSAAQAKHAALIHQHSTGSCQIWVPMARCEILCATCAIPKLPPAGPPRASVRKLQETNALPEPLSGQMYHGHKVSLCFLNWLQLIPDCITGVMLMTCSMCLIFAVTEADHVA